jgi:hypothetical protein
VPVTWRQDQGDRSRGEGLEPPTTGLETDSGQSADVQKYTFVLLQRRFSDVPLSP